MKPVMQQSLRHPTLLLSGVGNLIERNALRMMRASSSFYLRRGAPLPGQCGGCHDHYSNPAPTVGLQAALVQRSALRHCSVPHSHLMRRSKHSLCFVRNEREEYSSQFARAETSGSNSTQPVVCKGREMLLLVVMAQISHLMS